MLAHAASRGAVRAATCSRRAVMVRAEGATAVKERRPSPLARGGTLADAPVAASAQSPAAAAEMATQLAQMRVVDGKFVDDRWVGGRWDLKRFAQADGETNWDAVIDAEMARRKMLEDSPIPCTNEDPVNFDTAEIPWWAWVRRFHLPEAEKLNGRAAMLGYVLAGVVDLASGAGLVEQQESFLGKLALHLCVFAVLLVRSTADLDKYKNLIDEATFYDKQWSAAWDGVPRPSETEKSA